jgi:transcriptional regulator with XRE-family HTH domain
VADGTPVPGPGDNLRRLRRWRGLDQATLAGLVGRSQGWLSRIESGKLRLDSLADVEALAEQLQVHPGDITGRPHRVPGSPTPEVDALVPAIRVALLDAVPDIRPQPVALLADRVRTASAAMWRDGDMVQLAASLPGLIGSVRLAAANGGTEEDHRRGLQLAAVTASVAAPMLKHLGFTDLASVATQLCGTAAAELDDPLWLAYADVRLSHALIPAGAPDRALVIAQRAVDRIEPYVGAGPDRARMYGFANAVAAVWAARAGRADAADDHLRAADDVAGRLPDGDFWDLWFGPQNALLHRTQVAAALGETGRVTEVAAGVVEEQVPGVVQRSYLHTYVGQGLIAARRADEAVRELRIAEDLAPLRFRARDIVPPLVMSLLGQPMRPASLRELRGLAYRVGVG